MSESQEDDCCRRCHVTFSGNGYSICSSHRFGCPVNAAHRPLPETSDDHPYKTLCSCGAWSYDYLAHVQRESA